MNLARLASVMFIVVSLTAGARAATPFEQLLTDHWEWVLRTSPEFATQLGDRRFDDHLGRQSVASLDENKAEEQKFLTRAKAIDPATLSDADKVNRAVLLRLLETDVAGQAFPQRLILFTNRGGWHSQLTSLPDQLPFFTRADYVSYIARLNDVPRYNDEGIDTTRVALKAGVTQYCASMLGFEKQLEANIVADPAQSVFLRPFAKRPMTIAETDFAALRSQALTATRDKVIPAFKKFRDFYVQDYAPHCRPKPGIASLPQGLAFYQFRIREQTTTDMTPAQIHALGLSEVARIRAEMEAVVKRAGFKGTRAEFVARLHRDPNYVPASADVLLEKTGALMKQIDGELPKLFGHLPRLPYTVKAMEADVAPGNTTAYYEPGQAEAGRPGIYRVNTTELNQRPLYELPSLSLHEAVPGHHLQIALQQELPLPLFRRHVASFTAFVEGWGLYSERLGIEMGLYDTPEKDFSRLSYEMWRACRLVVDSGIHAMGWSREQAIAYMLDNTALTPANVEAEVNRYISWPGQALAYKVGELKIRGLRTRAEQKLGAKFDVRGFHDTVLENGAVPLDVLEAHVNDWINQQEQQNAR